MLENVTIDKAFILCKSISQLSRITIHISNECHGREGGSDTFLVSFMCFLPSTGRQSFVVRHRGVRVATVTCLAVSERRRDLKSTTRQILITLFVD